MKKDSWKVEDEKCVYCSNIFNEEHKQDCVMRNRSVVVKMEIELVVSVPEFYNENLINFRYNEGTYCSDNVITDLIELGKRAGCLCAFTSFEYVREATSEDERIYKYFIKEII